MTSNLSGAPSLERSDLGSTCTHTLDSSWNVYVRGVLYQLAEVTDAKRCIEIETQLDRVCGMLRTLEKILKGHGWYIILFRGSWQPVFVR